MMAPIIVFADDERGIRRFCKRELESAGYCVFLAGDGEEACNLVDLFPVDVAVLDLHMPRCGGLEAARRMKQWHPRLPVILYTVDPDYEQYAGPLVDASVVKSEDFAPLTAVIERCLARGSELPVPSTPSRQANCSLEGLELPDRSSVV